MRKPCACRTPNKIMIQDGCLSRILIIARITYAHNLAVFRKFSVLIEAPIPKRACMCSAIRPFEYQVGANQVISNLFHTTKTVYATSADSSLLLAKMLGDYIA